MDPHVRPGIVGAFVGGFLAEGLNMSVWWQILIVQAVVAAILVFVVAGFLRSRHSHSSANS
ncbi:MAG: GlsB/YeaQ/YmgE family stress response membrane protein [Marmoricola sp.]